MVAKVLVEAGLKVLMIERGDWVQRGPHNWEQDASLDLTRHYSMDTPLRIMANGNNKVMGTYGCVGGPSVFYGGVSFRFREADFDPPSQIIADSGAQWPINYHDIEPYYSEAEQILNVAGETGLDPTEPPRSKPYPQQADELAQISIRIKQTPEQMGLNPFPLPLAINYSNGKQSECIACTTCDTFACAISAKNDLATVVLPDLLRKGLTLQHNMVVTHLKKENNHINAVECISKQSGEKYIFKAKHFILSAGAIGSPHLLLSSGLDEANPGGKYIGRFLMRHVNAIVFGIFPGVADKEDRFHKQLGILDYYYGHPSIDYPSGKLGSIQQVQTPPKGLVKAFLPPPLGNIVSPAVKLLTGLLTIAEDQPQYQNYIAVDWQKKDRFGLPQPLIYHNYSSRDNEAIKVLIKQAKKILRKTGAFLNYVHNINTFSHAVGTVRMGNDPELSVLDGNCNFRGIDNLNVVDGSFMPTSAGLNPSLTIAANALRVGEHVKDNWVIPIMG